MYVVKSYMMRFSELLISNDHSLLTKSITGYDCDTFRQSRVLSDLQAWILFLYFLEELYYILLQYVDTRLHTCHCVC